MARTRPSHSMGMFLSDEKQLEQWQSLLRFYQSSLGNPVPMWSAWMSAGVRIMQSMAPGSMSAVPVDKGDKRFLDTAWDTNPVYTSLRNAYLTWRHELVVLADSVGLEGRDRDRARLLLSTFADTVAPTNTLLGNPAAMKQTLDSGGRNVVDGLMNFISDHVENGGMPSMVDRSAFKVGENLAITPGHVVYRNPHLELIQYTPTTDRVSSTPVFLVPPQINKFYVYDLAPGRSLVEYLVAQGHQVFVVSWLNPTQQQAGWRLDSYIGALDDATRVAGEITDSKQLHLAGACSGGISTTTLLGYWAARGIDRARSVSLLVTILDTDGSANTSLGLMTSLETLELARMASGSKGVLKGRDLARVFAWLRPNELIWSYWVNNYLMGNKPPAFDLLYWNADTTSLPAGLHSDFIDLLEQNALSRADALKVDGHGIDLSRVTCDAFLVAGATDHITPWEGCYRTMQLLGGRSEFCLSSSGHVQAIVNPPTSKRASFRMASGEHLTAQAFLDNAETREGTWWAHWSDWLKARSDGDSKAPAREGSTAHPPLCKAPGTYVLVQEGQA